MISEQAGWNLSFAPGVGIGRHRASSCSADWLGIMYNTNSGAFLGDFQCLRQRRLCRTSACSSRSCPRPTGWSFSVWPEQPSDLFFIKVDLGAIPAA